MSLLEKLLGKPARGTMAAGPYADPDPRRSAVCRLAAAQLLQYPDDALLDRLPLLRRALQEVATDGGAGGAGSPGADVQELCDWLTYRPLREVQGDYVQEFDLSRKHSLHLTYWTDGDTRRRGQALSGFKEVYRRHGAVTDDAELPDYLPMVLEFAARVSPEDGYGLLQRYRPSLELLRLALQEDGLPHHGAVALICRTLPGPSPADRDAVMQMAGYGPPAETVGLEPYDVRLLPVSERKPSP
ncbi:Nitrate reductase-like protein NarX [Arthrobacter saudimassiliensis]|uniref:Nitrate reductase-like protein NarX n=1 Tax=Arthrobacter saudimassiliensis TaxID=1461584 RepID=A0A078MUB5_9MICC|nr:Nitrate reductase-like protein NarX [Arthrobacter saudimassiliensis]